MFTVCINYPSQDTYKCPVCSSCYSIYSSWTRHLSSAHPDSKIDTKSKCDTCEQTFRTKRAVSNHHSKSHGKATSPPIASQEAGSFPCEFCQKSYLSKRSVTIPYEGDTDSFSKAGSEKKSKHQPRVDWLNMRT